MDFDAQLDAIEDLADSGDVPSAIGQLEALKPGLPPAQSAQLHVLWASLTARTGAFEAAFPLLDLAKALASAAARTDIALEAQVARASILAALGRYDEAIPLLGNAIQALREHPELGELLADATAELRGYRNLVSPKTQATWASLFSQVQ